MFIHKELEPGMRDREGVGRVREKNSFLSDMLNPQKI